MDNNTAGEADQEIARLRKQLAEADTERHQLRVKAQIHTICMEDTDLQDGDIVAEILSKDPRNGYDTTTGTIDVGRTRALLTTLKTLHPQYTYSKHPDPKYRDRSWRQKSRTTSTQQQPQQSEQPQGSGTYGGYALEKLFGKKMEPNKAFKLKKSDPAAWAAARQAAHEAGLI